MIFRAGGNVYKLAHEHKNGWDAEAFKERYSEVLDRYDYIVGDWGYNQLRLRGFFRDGHPRAAKDATISCLVDYINEYCNFGCAYFVLQKMDANAAPPGIPDLTAPRIFELAGKWAEGAGGQAAEIAVSAATQNGILMRWPLKERQGGPARMPGAAAVARAFAEAEKRQLQLQVAHSNGKSAESRAASTGHAPSEQVGGHKQGNRSSSSGGVEKRSNRGAQTGQAEERTGGKAGQGSGRGPKPQAGGRQQNGSADNGNPKPEGAKPSGRWGGKNRRRNRFGSKPNRTEQTNRQSGTTAQRSPAPE